VTQAAREKIRAALLKLDSTPSGRKILADVELDKVISADFARDYLPLAKLKVKHHTVGK
jgi:hypothetical protein